MKRALVAGILFASAMALFAQTASNVKLNNGIAVDNNNSPVLLSTQKETDGKHTLKVAGTVATTSSSATRTISITTVSTNSSVASGKHYIEFALSSDFTGTIGGVAYTGAATAIKGFPLLPNDTYGALSYTVTAGSAILTTF